MKEVYYVYRKKDNSIGRIAKRAKDGKYYGYEKGTWIEMPGLKKIEFEVTDYEEISKEEAMRLTKKFII